LGVRLERDDPPARTRPPRELQHVGPDAGTDVNTHVTGVYMLTEVTCHAGFIVF
jgi:hypothetical protein